MKNIVLLIFIVLIAFPAFAQSPEKEQPVYLRYPTVPIFKLYKAPDSTLFTRNDLKKNKPVMFFIFSPECSHCQRETELILENIEKFKDLQILMVTYLPYQEMMAFYNHYNIGNYPQITMARDNNFYFPVFFGVKNFPSMYFYDKKWQFQEFLEGDVKLEKLLEPMKK